MRRPMRNDGRGRVFEPGRGDDITNLLHFTRETIAGPAFCEISSRSSNNFKTVRTVVAQQSPPRPRFSARHWQIKYHASPLRDRPTTLENNY